KEFATLNPLELLMWIVGTIGDDDASHQNAFFNLQFSPDSHYLLAGRSNKFRFRILIDNVAIGETDALALDLSTGKPISASGDLKKATKGAFIFLAPDKFLATLPGKFDEAGIFTFPQGKRLAQFSLAAS